MKKGTDGVRNSLCKLINELGLDTKSRKRELVYARYVFYKELNKHESLQRIGDFFNRDHATVLHGIRQYDTFMSFNDAQFLDFVDYYTPIIRNILSKQVFNDTESIVTYDGDVNMDEVASLRLCEYLVSKKLEA